MECRLAFRVGQQVVLELLVRRVVHSSWELIQVTFITWEVTWVTWEVHNKVMWEVLMEILGPGRLTPAQVEVSMVRVHSSEAGPGSL